jgi:hypothetical protein
MRYHMLPKSKSSKEGCTEMVDVAAIGTSPPDRTDRDIHLTEGGLGVGNDTEKSAEVIVVNMMSRHQTG